MTSPLFIDSKCIDGSAGRNSDALDHVRRGGVVVFRDCLREIGYTERLRELTLEEMRLHCDAAQIKRIESEGFEKVHEILRPDQIFDVNVGLTERMKPDLGTLLSAFADQILGYKKRIYIFGLPVVRFFVPHDFFSANRALFSKRQGFLQIQGPHHDTWFDHATESLNAWIAIGRVRRGNGLIIYPDPGQNYLDHDGSRCMPKAQSLGRSISFDLEPGDIIFFHGETLHSSELNVTSETRYVVTNRFTLNRPRFTEHEQWQVWYDSALLGTALNRLAVWPTYLSRDYLLFKLKRSKLLRMFTKPKDRLSGATGTASRSGRPEIGSDVADAATSAAVASITDSAACVDDIAFGEIKAVAKDRCVLKTEHGLVAFSRFCPHEGADLAHAAYKEGRIVCPWHNLSFDAKTGQQPCKSLKSLRMFPVNDTDPSILGVHSTPTEAEAGSMAGSQKTTLQ